MCCVVADQWTGNLLGSERLVEEDGIDQVEFSVGI